MSRLQKQHQSDLVSSTSSNKSRRKNNQQNAAATEAREEEDQIQVLQHLNGHANGSSNGGGKRRRVSKSPATVPISNGTSKKPKTKHANAGSSGKSLASYNNNNNNITNGQYSNSSSKKATEPGSRDYSYRVTASPETPRSPSPQQAADVVCISDAESSEEREDYYDQDTEEDEEPQEVREPAASRPTNASNSNAAAAAAAAAAAEAAASAPATPTYAVPTSNSTPLDLDNESHQKDLEVVTDLRSYGESSSLSSLNLCFFH